MSEISINKRAIAIVHNMMSDPEGLGLKIITLAGGTKVIDAAEGGMRAGKLFAEICMGGLAEVTFTSIEFSFSCLPGVSVTVCKPVIACMASQYAGWAIKAGNYFAMGSGPARALSRVENLFRKLDYQDKSEVAIITLESSKLPDQEVAEYIAQKCEVSPEKLYILIAPTASIVGSVQISARVVETGLHKMMELGFDIECVTSAYGTCPIAPIAADNLVAMGRTNDCVLYAGRAFYTVQTDDVQIERIIDKIPSSSSRDYGKSFYDLFKAHNGDFYKIDPLLFSPAEIFINNITSGKNYHAGEVNEDVLRGILS